MSNTFSINEAVHSRYSTKAFDPSRKVSDEDFAKLRDVMRFSASSVNSQPWHFIVSGSDEGKARIANGAMDFNKSKVTDASHAIVYCVKTDVDDAYLDHLLEAEDKDGRFANEEAKAGVKGGRAMFAGLHKNEYNDVTQWFEKQAYLNMGTLLLAAGAMGIDAVPMEGVEVEKLNAEFGLTEKGFRAFAIVSLGYRSEEDFNAKLPKSRLSEDEIFTNV